MITALIPTTLAAASSGAAASRLPRVFVVGDSISVQYGQYLERFLAGIARYDRKRDIPGGLRAEHNLDVPTGASGGDSAMVLAYLRERRQTDPIRADVLVLNCGLHDLKRHPPNFTLQVPLDAYERNLGAILAEAREAKLAVVWMRTTPVMDAIHNERNPEKGFQRTAADAAAYNETADRVMRKVGVPIIDLHAFSAHFIPAGFVDHVHYSAEVQARQAAFIAGALSALLAGQGGR